MINKTVILLLLLLCILSDFWFFCMFRILKFIPKDKNEIRKTKTVQHVKNAHKTHIQNKKK
jgi:hypothetical protein